MNTDMSNEIDHAIHAAHDGQPTPDGTPRPGNGRDPILDAEIRLAWMTSTRDREATMNLADEARRMRGELDRLRHADEAFVAEQAEAVRQFGRAEDYKDELANLRDLIASIPPLDEVVPVAPKESDRLLTVDDGRSYLAELHQWSTQLVAKNPDFARRWSEINEAEVQACLEYESLRHAARSALAALGVRVKGVEPTGTVDHEGDDR